MALNRYSINTNLDQFENIVLEREFNRNYFFEGFAFNRSL